MKLLHSLRPGLIRRSVLARPALTNRSLAPVSASQLKHYSKESTDAADVTALLRGGPEIKPKDDKHDPFKTLDKDGKKKHEFRYHENCVQILDKELLLVPPARHTLGDRELKRNKVPYMWLRDSCLCADCVIPDTQQRSLKTFEVPEDIHAVNVEADAEKVYVQWSDDHQSIYDWEFLRQNLYYDRRRPTIKDIALAFWGAEAEVTPPRVDWRMEEDFLIQQLTDKLAKHGFCFVDNVPYDDPQDTKKLLERIAFIRETHYGGFYDFTADMSMADTAYTNLALPPHTDTTYFTDPAGLQCFHLLSHERNSDKPIDIDEEDPDLGGDSVLVDGFHAAEILNKEDPQAFQILNKIPVPWHASGNKGITIGPDKLYPVIEMAHGRVHRIRWNNDDRGVVPFLEGYHPDQWYKAARKFNEIINRPEMQYWFRMMPGQPVIFDNWRVLHGRSAFQGSRRICGGYINRDDWISRWMNTNYSREENLKIVRG